MLSDIFTGVISSGSSLNASSLENYVKERLAVYIFFFACGVLSILGMFIYFTSCCCPCCCCKKTSEGNRCRFFSIVSIFLLSIASIVLCIIGLIYAVNFLNGVTALNCAFMSFYFNILNGQNTTVLPKWIGISGIQNQLNSIQTALNTISQNTDNIFTNASNNFINTDPPQFLKSLSDLYSKYQTSTLPNPNPANSQKGSSATVTPSYINDYGNYTVSNKQLNMIYREYNERILAAQIIVQNVNSSTKIIKQNLNSIQTTLSSTSNQIGSLSSAIDSFGGSLLNPLFNAQTQVKKNGLTAFYIFFGVILGLGGLNLIGTILFGMCRIRFTRYLNHFAWVILSILIIINFILGAFFGIFGTLGQDLSSSFLILFSSTQIYRLFPSNVQAAQLLDVCVNQDGDISNKVFNLQNTPVDSVSQLTTASTQLNQLIANLTSNAQSISIPIINSIYANYTNDIRLVSTSDGNLAPLTVMNEWNKWSDSGYSGSFIGTCSNPSKDRWVQKSSFCPSGYTYTSKASASSAGSQTCLLISEWDSNSINSRYSSYGSCAANSDFTSAQSANAQYYNALNNYITSNTNLLNNLISDNNKYYFYKTSLSNTMASTMSKLIGLIQQVQGLINPLITITNQVVGSNASFYSMINCKFIGADLSNIINVFSNNFSGTAKNMGNMIIAISFINAVMIIFTVFMVNYTLDVQGSENNNKVGETELQNLN